MLLQLMLRAGSICRLYSFDSYLPNWQNIGIHSKQVSEHFTNIYVSALISCGKFLDIVEKISRLKRGKNISLPAI